MFTISTLALNAVSANIADRLGVAIPYAEHEQPKLGVAIPYAEHEQPRLGVQIPYAEHQQGLGSSKGDEGPELGVPAPVDSPIIVVFLTDPVTGETYSSKAKVAPGLGSSAGAVANANADLNGWNSGNMQCDCDVHCAKPAGGAPSYEEITIKVTCNCDCSGPDGTHEHAKSTTTTHIDTQNPWNDWTTSSSNVQGNDPWGWATANAAGNVDGWNYGEYNNAWSNANAAETNGWSTANANAGDDTEWYYPSYYLGADKEKDVKPAKAPKEDAQKRLGWGYFHEYKW